MSVGRDVGRRTCPLWQAGEGEIEKQADRKIDLKAKFGIAAIERGHIDVASARRTGRRSDSGAETVLIEC